MLVRTMGLHSLCRNSKAAGDSGTVLSPVALNGPYRAVNFFTTLKEIEGITCDIQEFTFIY